MDLGRYFRQFGFDRMDAYAWGAYLAGCLLTKVPGDNYLALRFIGHVLAYGVAVWWLVGFCRWCKAQGLRQSLFNLASLGPPLLLVWFWFAGPGHVVVRVVVGFLLYVLAAFAVGVVKQVIRERRLEGS